MLVLTKYGKRIKIGTLGIKLLKLSMAYPILNQTYYYFPYRMLFGKILFNFGDKFKNFTS